MKISIALCTYNGEPYLKEQLESLLNQTRLPDELIIHDDRSTDKTVEIIQDFKQKTPFPVSLYTNEENLGFTKNFEKAISLCTGDIIFLSDQDDVWLPEKIETIEAEFNRSAKIGVVFSDAELVDENLNPLNGTLWNYTLPEEKRKRFISGEEFEVLMGGNIVTGATMAFRAELKDISLPFPESSYFIHDGWISFIALFFFEVVPLKRSLIKYRQHSKQQIGAREQIKTYQNDRLPGYSRYQSYQRSIERCLNGKKKIEMLKQTCEIVLDRNSHYQMKLIRNPITYLNKINQRLNEAILHNTIRRDMPRSRIRRLPQILSEVLKGNYHKFSKGIRSAALDFVEKIS